MSLQLKHILAVCGLFLYTSVGAQSEWPTPEVEQLYKQARESLSRGNLKQAIINYQQVIQIVPTKMVLYRDLGQAYYLAGAYDEAIKTLDPIIKSGEADEQSYQITATCLAAADEKKKAKTVLKDGLTKFPHSGLLYHEMGVMHENEKEYVYALETWLDGIQNDPGYHLNYYEAARTYMNTNKPAWALLYGEMFVNMEQHTPRANETRSMIMAAYRRIFTSLANGEVPKFEGKSKKKVNGRENNFEEAVYTTFIKLSPVVSDGITAENLVMLRTRFIMDWYHTYAFTYPFSLFSRQQDMIRNGFFDAYNQWLFGRAENMQVYEAWNKFHKDAIPSLEQYLRDNPYRPVGGDFYNDKTVDGIFLKNKN